MRSRPSDTFATHSSTLAGYDDSHARPPVECRAMRLGLALPQYDYSVAGESPLSWATVVEWARAAEAAGYDSVWVSDHLFLDVAKYGGPPERHACLDPIVPLAALARAVDRVRLGTPALWGAV